MNDSWANPWNPFNSAKVAAQYYRWRRILPEGNAALPPPVLVTVDPVQACDLRCGWCNAAKVRDIHTSLSLAELTALGDALGTWGAGGPYGLKAVCIAGGGEPLLHTGVPAFIQTLKQWGIESGVVTNGTHLLPVVPGLVDCSWVGVSVDAATPETWANVKGIPQEGAVARFASVWDGITALAGHSGNLNAPGRPGGGVTVKYLVGPQNVREVAQCARMAGAAGARAFHVRPVALPWWRVGTEQLPMADVVDLIGDQLAEARSYATPDFHVYGVGHKLDAHLEPTHRFGQCWATLMTAVISPGYPTGYTVGVCCDRRGDPRVTLVDRGPDPYNIMRAWGSPRHWQIMRDVWVEKCPRCTYAPHNEFFENAILQDGMTMEFI